MTPDDALGRKAMQMLERAIDAGLAASPKNHELLRLGYDAANMLLTERLVAPMFHRDVVEDFPGEDSGEEITARMLRVDPLELAIGENLVKIADPDQDDLLLDALRRVRQEITTEYGLILPGVRVRPSVELGGTEFTISVNGDEVHRGDLGGDLDTTELIEKLRRVATTHLADLLTREEAAELLNLARQDAPMVVQELVPNMLALGQLRQVLQILVREQVPIRNLPLILNSLADHAVYTKDPYALAEHVRSALGRRICARHRSSDGTLRVIEIHPATDRAIQNSIQLNETGQVLLLDPNTSLAIERSLADVLSAHGDGEPVVVVTAAKLRRHVRALLARNHPNVVVLGTPEIEDGLPIKVVGTIDAGELARPMPTGEPPTSGDVGDVSSMRW